MPTFWAGFLIGLVTGMATMAVIAAVFGVSALEGAAQQSGAPPERRKP